MATWIVFISLIAPAFHSAPSDGVSAAPAPSATLRYRGIDALFAKFEAEADQQTQPGI